jgi:hypothetical protein
LNARPDAEAFQGVHQGQCIHHGGQHAHVIGRGAVHAQFQTNPPAPKVARPDDNGYIHAHFAHFFDPHGDIASALRVDTVAAVAGERFAAKFEQYAVEFEAFHPVTFLFHDIFRKKANRMVGL